MILQKNPYGIEFTENEQPDQSPNAMEDFDYVVITGSIVYKRGDRSFQRIVK